MMVMMMMVVKTIVNKRDKLWDVDKIMTPPCLFWRPGWIRNHDSPTWWLDHILELWHDSFCPFHCPTAFKAWIIGSNAGKVVRCEVLARACSYTAFEMRCTRSRPLWSKHSVAQKQSLPSWTSWFVWYKEVLSTKTKWMPYLRHGHILREILFLETRFWAATKEIWKSKPYF